MMDMVELMDMMDMVKRISHLGSLPKKNTPTFWGVGGYGGGKFSPSETSYIYDINNVLFRH